MSGNNLHKFFLSIVIPSIAAITLFVVSIFVFIIPTFENNIMDKKKEMISELTNSVWSLLEEYNTDYENNKLSKYEAQELAATRIEKIRYGKENKDYFWIIDLYPSMIMHPYRQDLLNSDLTDYKDPNGKKLFVEAKEIVNKDGEGFIDYMWQWKDDSTRIVPKLSYVRGFEPWGWIVGTGIYLEDVREEIRILKSRILRISYLITLIITIILLFVIRQSLNIEKERKDAELKLQLSKQKYKSLVEASTEGTLMIINQSIIFSNVKFVKLTGYDASFVVSLKFDDLFLIEWNEVVNSFHDPKKSVSLETKLKCHDKTEKDVIISVSKVKYAEDDGYIIVLKEISNQQKREKEAEQLTQELQTALLLMNQPIKHFVHDIIKCSDSSSIREAVLLMTKKSRNVLFIHRDHNIIGVVTDDDLKKRVLAEEKSTISPVLEVMTSPVISISENALLYEAILLLQKNQISHIAVKNQKGIINGVIGCEDIAEIQQNSVSFLIREIEFSEHLDQIKKIHMKVPVLVNALIESGDKTQNITQIITSISDAITRRIIQLAIEELGEPPCEFAFMVLGSEGRMEQTLNTDQDNAIIYEDQKSENDVSDYFLKMGQIVSSNLNKVGYKLCPGDNMASNPKWNQPYSVWEGYFLNWVESSDPVSILDASIFFDFRCVYGKCDFIDKLRIHVNEVVGDRSVFFYHIAQSVIRFKPPISVFGSIIGKDTPGEGKSLDIKKVLFAITGFVRLYALKNKISETNSLSRIRLLFQSEEFNKAMYDELIQAFNYLMHIRLRFQALSIMHNQEPGNIVNVNGLTHIEIATLKKIFSEISNIQSKLNADFKGTLQ